MRGCVLFSGAVLPTLDLFLPQLPSSRYDTHHTALRACQHAQLWAPWGGRGQSLKQKHLVGTSITSIGCSFFLLSPLSIVFSISFFISSFSPLSFLNLFLLLSFSFSFLFPFFFPSFSLSVLWLL